jgi:hypothetical protein
MSKRYVVLGLSVVLALALAVPALGGPSNPIASVSASAKKIAQKALKKANEAQKTANTALSTANTANTTANSALTEAKKAQTTANSAQITANSAKATADSAQAAAEAAEANANTRVKNANFVFGTSSAEDTETPKNVSASCESDEEVLGGGFAVAGEANKVTVTTSDPIILYGHGWFVTGRAISGFTPTWSIQAVATCGEK